MATLIIDPAERALLACHGLDGFEALWEVGAVAVDMDAAQTDVLGVAFVRAGA